MCVERIPALFFYSKWLDKISAVRRTRLSRLESILSFSSLDKTATAPMQSPFEIIGTIICAVTFSFDGVVTGTISSPSMAFAV